MTNKVHQANMWKTRYENLSDTLVKAKKEIPKNDIFNALIGSLMRYFKERYIFFHDGFFHSQNIAYIIATARRIHEIDITNETIYSTYTHSKLLAARDLINSRQETQRLSWSLQYPPEYVLKTLLNQVSLDLAVIQRAYDQRQVNTQQQVLRIADRLANQALDFAVHDEKGNGLIQATRAITYFEKSHSVRVIPYANVALVGIPYYVSDARDWMAIPHEVGHHVYWHGRYQGEPVANHMQRLLHGKPEWVHGWLEEIFADVFGYIVAGPLAVNTLQEMMFDNVPAALSDDDGTYPIPAIRPVIGQFVLEYFQGLDGMIAFPAALGLLEENWQSYLFHRGEVLDEFSRYVGKLKVVVKELCKFLTNVGVIDPNRKNNPLSKMWVSEDLESTSSSNVPNVPLITTHPALPFVDGVKRLDNLLKESAIGPLYNLHRQFEEFIEVFKKDFEDEDPDSKLDIPAHWENKLPPWSANPWHKLVLNPELNTEEEEEKEKLTATPMPESVWLPLFAAGGWTLEGPETEPVIG